MPLLIDSRFFRLQVCLNLFFLFRSSCLNSESLMLWEIFSPRNCKFSFSVSHSWSNHFTCDLHLIFLPLAFHLASLQLPSKFHLVIQTQYQCYHVWQLLLTWIQLFISIVICLPLPAPPGNTCRLLSVILLLPKIFLTILQFSITVPHILFVLSYLTALPILANGPLLKHTLRSICWPP